MNDNTRKALEVFVEEVEYLAKACYHIVGEDQVKDVYKAGERLKEALAKDETIS